MAIRHVVSHWPFIRFFSKSKSPKSQFLNPNWQLALASASPLISSALSLTHPLNLNPSVGPLKTLTTHPQTHSLTLSLQLSSPTPCRLSLTLSIALEGCITLWPTISDSPSRTVALHLILSLSLSGSLIGSLSHSTRPDPHSITQWLSPQLPLAVDWTFTLSLSSIHRRVSPTHLGRHSPTCHSEATQP